MIVYLGSFVLWLLNLLTFRGRLLNILVTSDTTLVKWADNNPDLLAYSTTNSFALSTAINLSILSYLYYSWIKAIMNICLSISRSKRHPELSLLQSAIYTVQVILMILLTNLNSSNTWDRIILRSVQYPYYIFYSTSFILWESWITVYFKYLIICRLVLSRDCK